MDTLSLIVGSCNIVIFFALIVFIIAVCWRKQHLTRFVWICLFQVMFCTAAVGSCQLAFSQRQYTKNCNFIQKMIYVMEILVIFNLSMLLSFKTNRTCQEINDFACKG